MPTLSTLLRRRLEGSVRQAREVADKAATDAVARLAIAASEAPLYLSEEQKALRRRLRAHARSLGDRRHPDGTMETARLAEAVGYDHWHRMLFGRFLVERNLLIHPSLGVALSRDELQELAEEEGLPDEWSLVEQFAAPSLPAVFKPDDPVLQLTLDPHFQIRLRALVTELPDEVFAADDSLGWTYQFWRAAEKKLIDQTVKEGRIKIGAAELPAVTQLFTEPYMVKFLLHNTLGAWWAGKWLASKPDLARNAPDEDTLREACALHGVEWEYLRFVREEGDRNWLPAAGTFPGWPQRAAEITYCDPCCGSGHFLVEAFRILAALRRAEEGLSAAGAARAVMRDNLHGLEVDGRCVQIAAFNVALAAWRLAGGPVTLPLPHIAWVGAPPPLPKSEFIALGNGDVELQRGLAALHDLFRQAPLLGSLIELTGGDLVDPTRIARLDQSITALVDKMRGAEPERAEGALAARGMAEAAAILALRFTLQATNVPFLAASKMVPPLVSFILHHFAIAKFDLSTVSLLSMLGRATSSGTVALVSPQNWYLLGSYRRLRESLLTSSHLQLACDLGPAAFHDMNWWAARTSLTIVSRATADRDAKVTAFDASEGREPSVKEAELLKVEPAVIEQASMFANPDSRIAVTQGRGLPLLAQKAASFQGVKTGDDERFRRSWWEVLQVATPWRFLQSTVEETIPFGGRQSMLWWADDGAAMARRQGLGAFGQEGVAVSQMRHLPVTIFSGDAFDSNIAPIIPTDRANLLALWTYCSHPSYHDEVRRIDRKVAVANATFVKVPFDLAHWQRIAAEKYPCGLPEPYSDDLTQWLFHGHPRYAERGTQLHVALARLAGYRWPAESDNEMRLSAEARCRIVEAATLPETDASGLLALAPVLGQRPLADRLRAYCAAAWGDAWQQNSEAALIAAACECFSEKPPKQLTFDAWLRVHAARQHAKLFHDRPFLWWIWDGRADGFTVIAHYHRLDRVNLERLTYSLLNDWIDRLGEDPRADAARILRQKLAFILEGEAPYDIFVRWKPIERQPLGWDPDLDDGVRLNIRPCQARSSRSAPAATTRPIVCIVSR
jgi:hypothetical protein